MSDESQVETREVQYDEGEETLVLEDGQIARRGEPVTVSKELAEQLREQSIWYDLSIGKDAELEREAAEHAERVAEMAPVDPGVTDETQAEQEPAVGGTTTPEDAGPENPEGREAQNVSTEPPAEATTETPADTTAPTSDTSEAGVEEASESEDESTGRTSRSRGGNAQRGTK